MALDITNIDGASYGENDVNSAPQIIDGDVDLTADDDDFDTGEVTVTGLLAEDRVGIFEDGTGPGQFSLSGSDVYYGGTLIGSFTGGIGNTFTVTLNSLATREAVEALIEHLTYANTSDTPTADRTLTLQVTNAAGDTLASQADFAINVTAANDAPTIAITTHEPAATGEVLVNSETDDGQAESVIAALPNGGHVIVWVSDSQDGGTPGIYMQRFDAAGAPAGGETLVNTVPGGAQLQPAVAVLADGKIVVAWQTPDAGIVGIASRLFDASGAPLGGETPVNLTTTGIQRYPEVGALAGGGYVIVWDSFGADGSGFGVYMQRYDASGATVGGESLVNTTTGGTQSDAAVAGLADGGYIVTWSSSQAGGGVYTQRYDASGVAQDGETLVGASGAGNQNPDVTVLADGGWLVVWQAPDGDGNGIFAQRFDSSGATVGGEVQLNSYSTNAQYNVTAAGLPDGGYAVAWASLGQDGSAEGIYARRFDAGGTPQGPEELVNSFTTGNQSFPTIAVAADGSYVVTWTSTGQDGDGDGIYSQRFDPNFTALEQVALDIKGNIALGDVDDSGGIYTLTLSIPYGYLLVQPGTSGVAVDDSDPQNVVVTGTLAQLQALLGSDPTSDVSFTADDDFPPATIDLTITLDDGTDSSTGTATIVITAVNDAPYLDLDYTDISAPGFNSAASWTEGDDPVALAFAVELDDDDADNSYGGATVTAAFTVNGSIDDELSILSVGDGLGELRVDGSDVYYEGTLVGSFTGGTNGNALVVTFNEDACHCAVQLLIGSIAFENTSGTPDTSQRTVTITLVDGGGTDNGGSDTASANVVIDVNLSGNSAPTIVITPPDLVEDGVETNIIPAYNEENKQAKATIATLADGSYVVVYESDDDLFDDSGAGVYARRFAADGTPIGSQFKVNSFVTGLQAGATVAALEDGGFVITWMSHGQDGSGYGIYAQRYDSAGAVVGGEFPVNTITADEQRVPVVAGLEGGGFVIAWEDFSGGSVFQIKAQIYDSAGAPVGSEVPINGTSRGDVPSITALAGGGFAVAWQTGDGSSSNEAYVRQFDADGDALTGSILVSTTSGAPEGRVSVQSLSDGGYVVVYQSSGPDGSGYGVFAQRYDAAGAAVNGPFQVNTTTASHQLEPVVIGLADGGFVIAWYGPDGDGYGIFARRYDAAGAALGDEFRINGATTNTDSFPALAALDDGGLIAAWQHNFDGTNDQFGNFDIILQRFDAVFAATEGVALDLKGSIAIGDIDAGSDTITVTLYADYGTFTVDPGSSGADVDDSDPYEIVITGTLAEIQALFGSDPTSVVTYQTEDINPPATAEIEIIVDDGIDTTTSTATIAITAVESPPELDLDFSEPGNDAYAFYAEGDDPAYLAFFATFEDDNEEWDGATLTIAITGATADDQLSIEDQGTGLGEISIDGSDILYEGVVVGSFTGGANGDPLVITFNEDACACAIELITASILYSNSDTGLIPSIRDVDFTFVDGSDTVTSTSVLEIAPVPSAPDIVTGGDGAAYQATAAVLTGVVITDAGDPVTGMITVQLSVEHGTLAIRTNVAGGIDSSAIVNGSGTGRGITIVATPDQINATLAAANGLSYTSDADFYGTDALTIRANDGVPASPVAISTLSALPFGAFPSAVAFTDLDGDLLDDLVLGFADPFGTDPGFVFVLANGPPGGFPLDAGAPEDFVFSDFDGDGEIDIGFAAYLDDGSSYVAYASTLTGDIETIAAVPYALDLASGDFDGNGLLDLAVADSDNGRLGVILQTAPGVFAAPVYSPTTGLLAIAVAVGDFNGDGVLDLLKGNLGTLPGFGSPGSVDLLLGYGDGTFAAPVEVLTGPSNVGGLIVADFNNDGFEDFAFASIGNATPGSLSGVQVVLGNGDGTFDAAVSYVTTATGSPSRVVAGDINGDGIDDLVVANFDDPGTLSILVGNGDGSFQAAVDIETGDLPYVIALGDPDGDGDLDIMVGNAADGSFEAFNSNIFHRGDSAVKTIIVNGLSVAVNDSGSSVAENATVAIDVVANDTDPENDARSVASIAGQAATVGVAITLASGARATLNANGTITYDPNGAFNSLIGPGKAVWTGGSNLSAPDSFSYTLANGTTATVSVTVTGVDSATGDIYAGSAGNDVLAGYPGNDFFRADQGGNDRVAGGSGDDTIYFGSAFTTADTVRGGLGNDIMILQGSYALTFIEGGVLAIEMLLLMSAADTRYGASGTGTNTYDFIAINSLVPPGVQMTIQGNNLRAGETLHFDGSAETDGSFRLIGGAADDVLKGSAKDDMVVGGLGVDILSGGLGDDLFVFRTTGELTLANPDQILDFNAGDRIDLRGIDAILGIGGNDAFTFIGSGAFSNTAGELRAEFSAGTWSVSGDVDGDGTADFLIHVQTTNGHPLGSGDFWL